MNRKKSIISIFLLFWLSFPTMIYAQGKEDTDGKTVKIILREIGNQLLLSDGDSTSRVLPVTKKGENSYQITFESEFSFQPENLVSAVKDHLEQNKISENYIVEVLNCYSRDVQYSFEINKDESKTIIPCFGRTMPYRCYVIDIEFLETENSVFSTIPYILPPVLIILLVWIFYPKKIKEESDEAQVEYETIGHFTYYSDQNKLVNEDTEVSLSKKESELLNIFVANKNQVIKREDLSKQVWEDHGVIVGRSLDTYISKLRKILKSDSSLKLTNIHGVGYKLEIKDRVN
ncbi:MAG: helix-turn-helix domain-containing protein [Nonlabens sp.]